MSEQKHTPGPWVQRVGHLHDVEAPEHGHVASCETVEDARLIAAAPDMLKELAETQNVLALLMEDYSGERLSAIQQQFAANRAALAKATGAEA